MDNAISTIIMLEGKKVKKTSPITVITITYNSEKYIERAINSVLNQTILPEKYIIVDNNSMDNTVKIVSSFSEKHSMINGIR